MMRSYAFNLGRAYQAQRHAAQAWAIMDVARGYPLAYDRHELIHLQREARYTAREAREEYAITCGYPLD